MSSRLSILLPLIFSIFYFTHIRGQIVVYQYFINTHGDYHSTMILYSYAIPFIDGVLFLAAMLVLYFSPLWANFTFLIIPLLLTVLRPLWALYPSWIYDGRSLQNNIMLVVFVIGLLVIKNIQKR